MIKILSTILALSISLSAWSFTDKDYNQLSQSQRDNLDIVYMVWESKGYGLRGVSKSIVENMGRLKDSNPNHICGPLQVDINFSDSLCIAHETNPYYAAKVALKEFLDWKSKHVYRNGKLIEIERSDDQATIMYNIGYTRHPFGKTHLKKVHKAEKILRKYYE